MTEQPQKDSPDLRGRRTTPRPAPDQHRDSADPTPVASKAASVRGLRKLDQLNIQISEDVAQTLERAKFETRKTKRGLTEEAILAYWGKYRPEN